jgi:hypothetical protein
MYASLSLSISFLFPSIDFFSIDFFLSFFLFFPSQLTCCVLVQSAQMSGDMSVADEQRRFASYASSDVRRFEEQRAALLR